MSYADAGHGRRFNLAGLAATLMINGGMIAAVVSFVPQAGEQIIDWFPQPFTPAPEQPRIPEAQKPKQQEDRRSKATDAPVTLTPPVANPGSDSDNNLLTGGIGTLVLPPLPPIGTTIEGGKDVEPQIAPRVRIGAKLDPRYASALQPDYPPALARNEIEGSATVRVLVGADGRVKQVEKIHATEDGFFDATRRQALAKWRFKPATEDGVAVESWREMTVRFELRA